MDALDIVVSTSADKTLKIWRYKKLKEQNIEAKKETKPGEKFKGQPDDNQTESIEEMKGKGTD